MNTLHAIYVLSTSGAALFYAAGYLTRGQTLPQVQPAIPPPEQSSGLSAELAALRGQLAGAQLQSAQLRDALGAAEQHNDAAGHHLEAERRARQSLEQTNQALDTQLRAAAQRADQASSGVAQAESSNRELSKLLAQERAARAQIEQELVAARGAAGGAPGELSKTKPGTLSGIGPAERESAKRVEALLRADLEGARADAKAALERSQKAEAKLQELRTQQSRWQSAAQQAAQLPALQRAFDQKAAENARLGAELEQVRAQLQQMDRDAAGLRTEASQGKKDATELDRLRRQLDELRTSAAQSAREKAELEQMRQQIVELRDEAERGAADRTELNSLRAQLKQALNELDVFRRKAASADALLEQLDDAKAALARVADLERMKTELSDSKNEARQLRIDLQVAAERIVGLEHSAQEAAGLRAQTAQLDAAKAELSKLHARVRALESSALVAAKDTSQPTHPTPGGPFSTSHLDHELSSLLGQEGMRSAVIADPMGLLIAAAGDDRHHEGMGAMAGVASQLVDRVTDLLPIAGVRRMHLADANNLVVSCGMVRWQQEDVVLVTLSSGMPSPTVLGAAVEAIGSIASERV